jgi:hypothetical protein
MFFIVFCVIQLLLGAHVLGLETQGGKGLISYKTKSGTSTIKKHCETKHSNNLNIYIDKIV